MEKGDRNLVNDKIQLSIEEALAYQKHESELRGFCAGVAVMAEHSKRMKVLELLAARKPKQEQN